MKPKIFKLFCSVKPGQNVLHRADSISSFVWWLSYTSADSRVPIALACINWHHAMTTLHELYEKGSVRQ